MRDLAWLDEVDEETERALSPVMRELVEELRRLKEAEGTIQRG